MFYNLASTFIITISTIKSTFAFAWYMFCYVSDSFIPAIMLKALRFRSSVLFGTHTLLDKSLRALQLSTHLSKLTASGW